VEAVTHTVLIGFSREFNDTHGRQRVARNHAGQDVDCTPRVEVNNVAEPLRRLDERDRYNSGFK